MNSQPIRAGENRSTTIGERKRTDHSQKCGCEDGILRGENHDAEAAGVRVIPVHEFLVFDGHSIWRDPKLEKKRTSACCEFNVFMEFQIKTVNISCFVHWERRLSGQMWPLVHATRWLSCLHPLHPSVQPLQCATRVDIAWPLYSVLSFWFYIRSSSHLLGPVFLVEVDDYAWYHRGQ